MKYTFQVRMKLVKIPVKKVGSRYKQTIVMPDNTLAIVGIDASERPAVGPMLADIRYYGIGAPGENSEAFITALTREYMGEVTDFFEVNAGVNQKVYYAQPKRLGLVEFEYTGIVGGFLDPVTVSVTDPVLQSTEDYYLWESAVDELGAVAIYVNQP